MTNDEKTAVMAGQLDGWASSSAQPVDEPQTPAERTLERLRVVLGCAPSETVEDRAAEVMERLTGLQRAQTPQSERNELRDELMRLRGFRDGVMRGER